MSNQDDWRLSNEQEKAEQMLKSVVTEAEVDTQSQLNTLANQSAVESELQKPRLTESVGDRSLPRLLFVTADTQYLDPSARAQLPLFQVAGYFGEIHVVVLVPVSDDKRSVDRVSKNMWVYTTGHPNWWQTPWTLLQFAKDELVFTDGFRADVIVADDPYEGAVGAMWLANRYQRPFQVHVKEAFWEKTFAQKSRQHSWRQRIARYVLRRSISVRTQTESMNQALSQRFKGLEDLAVLPRHYNLDAYKKLSTDATDSQSLFPDYSMVLLYVGRLSHASTFFRALDAARLLLKNESIALVVVGDGPAKPEFEKRAQILGVANQVIFKSAGEDLKQYLDSADIVLITDTDEASDEVSLRAAAAGVPMLAAKTALRSDLFRDGDTAFLCNPDDTAEFTQKLTKFINTPGLRTKFADRAQQIVTERLHEDPVRFQQAYVNSLLRVFNTG